VPDITKKTASDADKLLREKELTLGQASPQPVDPKGLIVSQILTLFTTPVVYLYLDKLSNTLSGWGRGTIEEEEPPAERGSVKEAAE